jgi:tRNA1Val (adenine37-N6)-methyltransferase
MANSYFQFKQFTIHQDRCAMKVTTDGCLFGAWAGNEIRDQKSEVGSILDIGTGTALLGIMLAQRINAVVDAIEIDEDAATQAAENSKKSPWKERIRIIHGDVNDQSALLRDQYDVIVSNPPFYENELPSPHVKKNIAHHDQGLLLPDLLQIIGKKLAPEGLFCLLLPYKRMEDAVLLIQKSNLAITHITQVRQSTQHGYFRIFISGSHADSRDNNYSTNEIAIRNEQNEYTTEFTGLLKDYYLHL